MNRKKNTAVIVEDTCMATVLQQPVIKILINL